MMAYWPDLFLPLWGHKHRHSLKCVCLPSSHVAELNGCGEDASSQSYTQGLLPLPQS